MLLSKNIEIEDFWMKQVEENCKPGTEKILIGNKIDLIVVNIYYSRISEEAVRNERLIERMLSLLPKNTIFLMLKSGKLKSCSPQC